MLMQHCNQRWLKYLGIIWLGMNLLIYSGCNMYHMEINQGDRLNVQQLELLKKNMTKQEVIQILGLPVLEPLSTRRLDYLCTVEQHEHKSKQHISLFFNADNRLVKYEIDGVLAKFKSP